MKRLLLSTAILGAALAAPAIAQDQSIFREAPQDLEIRASDFLGMRVYASEAALEGEEFQGVQDGWEDIGEVNDVVMDRDGALQAVLVDVGGFLGIGERTLAVSMDALQFVSDSETAEDVGDFFLVINADRAAIEGAPEYTRATEGEMTAEQAAEETDTAIEEGAADVAAAGATAGAAAGAAVEGAEDAGEEVAEEADAAAEATGEAAEETGDAMADAAGNVAEGTENAVEETGEEIADAADEVADEAADAGEEVAEEVGQLDMADEQEDTAEVQDETQDAQEEAAEEAAQASDEAADESADQAEAVAEADADAAEETAEASEEAAEETAEANAEAAEETAEAATAEDVARTPVEREGFVAASGEDFTADRLQGAAVYDANDERVGEVGEIILATEGQVQELVIDVGGFLGIGEKPVALPMDSLDILRQDGGEEIRVYVSQTEEELEAMERYEPQ